MNTPGSEIGLRKIRCKSQERFRLHFRRELERFVSGHHSAAEGFGLVWEKTLDAVPLDDSSQAELYRELIHWARSGDIFTGPHEKALVQAWRQAVHEF